MNVSGIGYLRGSAAKANTNKEEVKKTVCDGEISNVYLSSSEKNMLIKLICERQTDMIIAGQMMNSDYRDLETLKIRLR